MKNERCAHHSKTFARWQCHQCRSFLCDECVEARKYERVTVEVCRECGVHCLPYGEQHHAEEKQKSRNAGRNVIIAFTFAGFCFSMVLVSFMIQWIKMNNIRVPTYGNGASTNHYEWELLESSGAVRTVYVEPAGYDDGCFLANVIDEMLGSMQGTKLDVRFYNDRIASRFSLNAQLTFNSVHNRTYFRWVDPTSSSIYEDAPVPNCAASAP